MASLIDTYALPPDALLKQHDGACRYISHTSGKTLTKAQVKHIHGLGKVIVLNFEDFATNAKKGHTQGVEDATFAIGQAKALGAPAGCAIYYSVDYEIHSGFTTEDAYFDGIASVHNGSGYPVGGYGCHDLIKHLLDTHRIDLAWQCASWSYGVIEPRAVLFQSAYDGSYDVDTIQHPYFGAWTPTGAQTPPEPDLNKDQTTAIAHDEVVHGLQSLLLGGKHGDADPAKNPRIFRETGKGLLTEVETLQHTTKTQAATIEAQAKTITKLTTDLAALTKQVQQLAAKS